MAFQAGGTDYAGFQRTRDRADEGLTRAQDSAGRAAKQARIKKSGERSGLQKLVSAGVRGAAAYYSGGLSEQMGAGGMIDEAMLGTDSEGRAVRNEYGDLVGAGSAIYQGSKAQKAGKLGEQDARFDKLLARRSKNVSDLYAAGDLAGGKEAQASLEQMEMKYNVNRKEAESKGWGGSGLGMSDEDYNLMAPKHTPESVAAEVKARNEGTYGTDTSADPSEAFTPIEFTKQEESRFRPPPSSLIPPKADAPQGPTSFGVPDDSRGVQPVSAAETATSPSSQYQLRGKERERKQDDLIERLTGSGGKSDQDLQQERALRSWTSNMTDVSDPNLRILENWKKQKLTNRGAQ